MANTLESAVDKACEILSDWGYSYPYDSVYEVAVMILVLAEKGDIERFAGRTVLANCILNPNLKYKNLQKLPATTTCRDLFILFSAIFNTGCYFIAHTNYNKSCDWLDGGWISMREICWKCNRECEDELAKYNIFHERDGWKKPGIFGKKYGRDKFIDGRDII
ncbi:MAG: hypothetical protein IJP61_01025 [Treponema sp.]|nr:hypothetical protein [Treponema sp.]